MPDRREYAQRLGRHSLIRHRRPSTRDIFLELITRPGCSTTFPTVAAELQRGALHEAEQLASIDERTVK